jgi:NADPH:quinone reductase-like Zn-dependent oxidoreductase
MLAITYIRKMDFSGKISILINGASGSIGSACVQLARNNGADITAVCDTRNVELVKKLGAGEVIDYKREDFTKSGKTFDVIMDAVGKSSFFRCRKMLKPGGIYFSTELGFLAQNVFLALFSSIASLLPGGKTRKKVKFPVPKDSKEDIVLFKELIEEGKYIAVIDRCYVFDNIVDATKYVETGMKAGNVVITMG